jgi:hypothetical protein
VHAFVLQARLLQLACCCQWLWASRSSQSLAQAGKQAHLTFDVPLFEPAMLCCCLEMPLHVADTHQHKVF